MSEGPHVDLSLMFHWSKEVTWPIKEDEEVCSSRGEGSQYLRTIMQSTIKSRDLGLRSPY